MANRYFSEFVAANESAVTFPSITLTGDYTISLKFFTRAFSEQMALGDSANSNTRLWIKNDGGIQWNVNGQIVAAAAGTLTDIHLHETNTLSIARVSGSTTLTLNGVVVAGPTAQSNDPSLDRIGRYASNLFWFDGLLFDVDINSQRSYALDESGATAVDSIGGQNGTYVNVAAQQLFTETINAVVTKYARNDGGLTLFYSDTRTKYQISYLGDSIFFRPLDDGFTLVTNVIDQYAAQFDADENLRVRPWNDGVGSQTIAQVKARLPAILTRFSGVPDVLIVIQAGINDRVNDGPWLSLTGPQQATKTADLTSMPVDILAAGHDAAICSVSSVFNASFPNTDDYTTYLADPVCAAETPDWYNSTLSMPTVDIQTETAARYIDTVGYYDADLIHHTPATGMPMLKAWMAGVINTTLNPVTGPTLTGPASAQEDDAINAVGTGLTSATLDLITTVGGHVAPQTTTGVPTDTLWPYTVDPKTGVPFSVVDIQAAGVTLWVTEQRATDGTSATNVMTIAAKTNETVIQGMIATSNTTPGESIFATNILAMQDNLQANAPTLVDGVTITWFADGTFTVDINQAISFSIDYFDPTNPGPWESITLNVSAAGIVTVGGMLKPMIESMIKPMIENIIH